MTDVRKNGKLWWWYADGAGGDSAVAKGKEYQQVPPWVVLFFLSTCVGGWYEKRSEKSTIRMRIVISGHNNCKCKCLLNSTFSSRALDSDSNSRAPPGWSSVVPALAAFVLFFCLLRGLSTLVTAGALRLLADFPGFI